MPEKEPSFEDFWFDASEAESKYDGKRIRYHSPYNAWRVGTLQIRNRSDYDEKICATIREDFPTSRYSRQVFTWRLTKDLYTSIRPFDGIEADFELPD